MFLKELTPSPTYYKPAKQSKAKQKMVLEPDRQVGGLVID